MDATCLRFERPLRENMKIPRPLDPRPSDPPASAVPPAEPLSSSWLFHGLVLVFCLWTLSLPLFPTQDGPMHKYYVHAIASLLSGSHDYSVYRIRHPIPPYAIHYALLLVLTRVVSYDLAEKLFVCLILLCTAYGFRYSARSLGPSGGMLSLCMAPLLLHWSLTMGFLNYSLAIGLFFLAVGLWLRASVGRRGLWPAYVFAVAILTLTHPVPLLLLIAFCALDTAIRLWQESAGGRLRRRGWQLMGLAAACLAFLYPLASADRSRSVSNLAAAGLHKDAFLSSLALAGVSPFDTRSMNPLIDLYRVGLYLMLLGSLALAAAGFGRRWRSRQLRPGDSLLIGSAALLLAIPILPPSMNGSDYFAPRLMIFGWLGALAAASGYEEPGPSGRRPLRFVPLFATIMVALTLLPAERFFRPVARQLAELEAQPLPGHAEGLALLGKGMLGVARRQHQLGFNPYLWSGALPLLRSGDVMLNSPWLDLTIMPVEAAPRGDLLVERMESPQEAERRINGNVDLPALPDAIRGPLLAAARVIVFVGAPQSIAEGLAPLTGIRQAALYACSSHGWYLACTRP